MPLIGLVDPSHNERAADAPGRFPQWLPVEDLLGESLTRDPKWSPWTYELIAAVMNEWQERDYLSVTALTGGCMRGNVIERKEPYIATLDSLYAALRGTLIHRTMESAARQHSIAEARFWTTIDGEEISCSPDLITLDDGTLWDYKTTENPPTFGYPYRHHTEQLQFNRFVVNHAERWVDSRGEPYDLPIQPQELRFQHLAVVYLGPKGPKVIEVQTTAERSTPNGRTVKRKVPDVWSNKKVLEELRPRIESWHMGMEAYPEWPDGLEKFPGWAGGPSWRCPGPPICNLPNCTAKRWPDALAWENPPR